MPSRAVKDTEALGAVSTGAASAGLGLVHEAELERHLLILALEAENSIYRRCPA